MKNLLRNAIGLGAFLFAALVLFMNITKPDTLNQLLVMGAIPVILVAAVGMFVDFGSWRSDVSGAARIRGILSACGLLVFLVVVANAKAISVWPFEVRRASMEHLLRDLPQSDDWLTSARNQIKVPNDISDYFSLVRARNPSPSETEGFFVFGGGFPVHHYYWYYSAKGTHPDSGGYRQLDKNWFLVSN